MLLGFILVLTVSLLYFTHLTSAKYKVDWQKEIKNDTIYPFFVDHNNDFIFAHRVPSTEEYHQYYFVQYSIKGNIISNSSFQWYPLSEYYLKGWDDSGKIYYIHSISQPYLVNNFTIVRYTDELEWISNFTLDWNQLFTEDINVQPIIGSQGNIFVYIHFREESPRFNESVLFKINSDNELVWNITIDLASGFSVRYLRENKDGDVYAYFGNVLMKIKGTDGSLLWIRELDFDINSITVVENDVCVLDSTNHILLNYITSDNKSNWELEIKPELELPEHDTSFYESFVSRRENIGLTYSESEYDSIDKKSTQLWKCLMINKDKKILAEEEWKWVEYYEEPKEVEKSYYLYPTTEDKFYLILNTWNLIWKNGTSGIIKLCTVKTGLLPGYTLISTLSSLIIVALIISVIRMVKLKK